MPKIKNGEVLEDFTFDTPFEEDKSLYEVLAESRNKTALLFLRYYGCTLCQMDIHHFIKDYSKIRETGSQIIIVLQSNPESIRTSTKQSDFPFEIICDPEATLYRKYDIKAASSKRKMVDGKTIVKVTKATFTGFKHGAYEGNEQQLPASFILDKNAQVLYTHYGKSAGDVPTVKELVKFFRK